MFCCSSPCGFPPLFAFSETGGASKIDSGWYFSMMPSWISFFSAYWTLRLPFSGTTYGCSSSNSIPHLKKSLRWTFIGCTPVFMTINSPFGMAFNSSGVIKARSTICKDCEGLSFPLLIEPDMTVRLPSAFDRVSADELFGAKPPNSVICVLSTMISAPSLP